MLGNDVVHPPELADRIAAGSLVQRWLMALSGVLLGSVTAVSALLFTVVALLVLTPARLLGRWGEPVRAAVDEGALGLSEWEIRRIARFHGRLHTDVLTPRRCRWYLGGRWTIGLLGTGVVLFLALCLIVAGSMVSAWIMNGNWGLIENSDRVDGGVVALVSLPGTLLIFVAIAGVVGVGSLDRWFVIQVLGRQSDRLLHQRVVELTSSRDHVVDAIDDERRRIERDLHDGVQQQLVAVGMLIGRARRAQEPEKVHELLTQAHVASQEAISELREVANRVYPIALDQAGLHTAVETMAERASVPVRFTYELTEKLRPAVETVLYFVISEAVTNAAKHASPRLVEVSVTHQRFDRVLATIVDDGPGGADPSGTGLSGLSRRVAAMDGTLTVHSPVGGPTVVTASVPCE
ncbi:MULTISPECIES: sensor histidine kinase [unclassified Rhodococcus (in: high G+C Gram-positive bacteria)]|uniref:sensor histidine kinase n=1 Tax=unclassified Rhodococcus (in: high G+C Gram-positive bacteria) TaxID=192944 RepID=UPI000B9ACD47|nr:MULTISPECIES: histidine kinase [unclassified Rhodococcus (in: high G+C Gram-positive bacteria)]OZE36098.1 two-component sensor histidine kinase [Rhodococcus sp. 05-2254-4]OZE41262.1 two-component sensor histidine kinase [Rhodococcus sp. 05-2254-3]OZE44610.1 two-component sensor histidine kinase [Rhodococcus sp. 05-2254-2]